MSISAGKKVIISFIVVLVFAILAEVGFRIVFKVTGQDPETMRLVKHDAGMKIQGRYISNPFLPFALRPSSDYKIMWSKPPWPELKDNQQDHVWKMHHNKWGFRGPEIKREKAPGTLRVVCLGGSTTYDTSTDGETWNEKLQVLLQKSYPEHKIEVLNFGMNSASMPFHITMLALNGIHFNPDLVILYAGHNDLWSGLGRQGFRADYSHRLGHWNARRSIQYYIPKWMMKSVAVTGLVSIGDKMRGVKYDLVSQIWRNTPPSKDSLEGFWSFENGIKTINGIAMGHDAKTLVVTPFFSFHLNERNKLFVSKIKKAAENANIPLLDAANIIPKGDTSLMVDDVHFGAKGNVVFANLLADFITKNKLLGKQ